MFGLAAWVQRETWGYDSCLEFGSGRGAYTREVLCPVVHGIEAHEPYVNEAMEMVENQECAFILGDMRRFDEITDRAYDIGMFIDSIEHLSKVDALDLLSKCKTRFKKIILFLPVNENGAGNQDYYDENPLQRHLSDWTPEQLESLGFVIDIRHDFHKHLPEGNQGAAMCVWLKP